METLRDRLFTDRLILTPPHEEKSDSLLTFYLHNRTFHAPFEYSKPDEFYTLSGINELLAHQVKDQDERRALFFTLSLKGSKEVIGTISCTNIIYGPFCSTFLGYRLSHDATHNGYMGEALRTVIDYGCNAYNLHRFEANIMPGNHASIRVVESLGFKHEGYSPAYLYIAGSWEGHNHYVFIHPHWNQ